MNEIATIKTWPNDAVVEAVQGKLVKTYEVKTVNGKEGPSTVQNAELLDAGGNKIRLSVWNHPDLKAIEGKEVVLHSNRSGNGRFGGVKVRHSSYTNKAGVKVNSIDLEVGKLGTFQLVEVYQAQNPASALKTGDQANGDTKTPTPTSNPVIVGQKAANGPSREESERLKAEGQRSGMCFKLAGDYAIATRHPDESEDDFVGRVKRVADKLVIASRELDPK